MTQEIAYIVSIRGEVAQADVDELIQDLKLAAIEVERPEEKAVGVDDIALVIGLVSGSLSIIDYSIKGAKILWNWLQKQREKGREVNVELKHPKRKQFDMRIGTEEDLEKWLSR